MKHRFVYAACIALLVVSCASRPAPSATEPAKLSEAQKQAMELDVLLRNFEQGNYEAAETSINSLIARNPDNRSYPVLKASILMSAGKQKEARDILNAEASAHPDNSEAVYALAELDRFEGNTKSNRANLEAVLARDPKNPEALSAMGDSMFDGKNYSKAEEYYKAALAIKPDEGRALVGFARIQYRKGNAKGAIALLDKAIEANPADAVAFLDRSRALYNVGRYKECEQDLNTAIRLAPESSWNYVERGKLYLDTNRKKEALDDFEKAIKLNPDYFLPYIYRASLYEADGNDKAAYDDYVKASTLYPEYWFSFEAVGVLAYRLGRWAQAAEAFDKAASYTKSHTEYYIGAALSLMRSGDAKAAKAYAGKNLSKIDKTKFPAQWLALRMFYDQNEMTAELEVKINTEKSLDTKAGLLFYLGAYWLAKGRQELGVKYVQMSFDAERMGTIERRMAEGDLLRANVLKK